MNRTQVVADPMPERRRRPLFWAAVLLPVAAWTGLALGGATVFRGSIERQAGLAIGRTVTIAGPIRILLTPSSLHLSAERVTVANPSWALSPTLLTAGRLDARIALFDLLIGKPAMRALAMQDGDITVERRADGRSTLRLGGRSGGLLDLANVQQVQADRTRLRIADEAADVRAELDLALRDGVTRFAGRGRIGKQPLFLHGSLDGSRAQGPHLDLAAETGNVYLAIRSHADRLRDLSDAQFAVTARGSDLAELAALAGVALPPLPGYDLRARLDRHGKQWRFSRIGGRLGRSDLAGTLTLDRRKKRPSLVANLTSDTLDLGDLQALLHIGPAAPGRLLPEMTVSPTSLAGFDAAVDYNARRVPALGQASGQLTLKLALVRGALLISPATIDLAGGFLSADLLVDSRISPALLRADIRLSPTPMGPLLAGWGISANGTTAHVRGRIMLAGRGNSLAEALARANGRMAMILPAGTVQLQQASTSPLDMTNVNAAVFGGSAQGPSSLNCGLLSFRVAQGIATAEPVIFDTRDHVLATTGTIDLAAEALDLRLKADGKAFALFARPSRVTIGGTLAAPEIYREPQPLLRSTSLFGFAFAVPDLSALLGFVDPDDARPPSCDALVHGGLASAN